MSVDAWSDARVMVLVIDRAGHRTGWTQEGPIDEIKGCVRGSGSEEGIPNPDGESGDTLQGPLPGDALIDTVPREAEPTPKYYYFHISNDAVTPTGLIDQGGCELRLDPVVAGKVQLGLSVNQAARILCQDTTSVWVRPGVPLRWRLTWKAERDRCAATISRIATTESKGTSKR